MKIYVTRHGQTNWNIEKKVMGRFDEPLNEKGFEQAENARLQLMDTKIDLIICSPLTRAKQTADIINKGRNIPIIYDDRIIERDFGEFEGLNTRDFDFLGFWDYYQNNQYQKAENIQDFFKRIYEFIQDISQKFKNRKILIVAHGGVSIPIACYYLNGIPKGTLVNAGLVLENAQIAEYDTEEKEETDGNKI